MRETGTTRLVSVNHTATFLCLIKLVWGGLFYQLPLFYPTQNLLIPTWAFLLFTHVGPLLGKPSDLKLPFFFLPVWTPLVLFHAPFIPCLFRSMAYGTHRWAPPVQMEWKSHFTLVQLHQYINNRYRPNPIPTWAGRSNGPIIVTMWDPAPPNVMNFTGPKPNSRPNLEPKCTILC